MNKDTKSPAQLNRITYSRAKLEVVYPVFFEAIVSAFNKGGHYSNIALALSGLAGSAAYSVIVAPAMRREGSVSRLRNQAGFYAAMAIACAGAVFGDKVGAQLDDYAAQINTEAKIDQACIDAGGVVGESDSEPLVRSCIFKNGSVVKIRMTKIAPTP